MLVSVNEQQLPCVRMTEEKILQKKKNTHTQPFNGAIQCNLPRNVDLLPVSVIIINAILIDRPNALQYKITAIYGHVLINMI